MNLGRLLTWAGRDQQPGSITMSAGEPEELVSAPEAGASVADNLAAVGARVAAAAAAAGRDPGSVALVAVGKMQPPERLVAALAAGHRLFGENRVQEAAGKFPALKTDTPDLVLHLIGPLQTNKAAEAVALFDVIETLDRPKLARARTEHSAADHGSTAAVVLVLANLWQELQAHGADEFRECLGVHVRIVAERPVSIAQAAFPPAEGGQDLAGRLGPVRRLFLQALVADHVGPETKGHVEQPAQSVAGVGLGIGFHRIGPAEPAGPVAGHGRGNGIIHGSLIHRHLGVHHAEGLDLERLAGGGQQNLAPGVAEFRVAPGHCRRPATRRFPVLYGHSWLK